MSKTTINLLSNTTGFKSLLSDIPEKFHYRLEACNDFKLPCDWGFENRNNTNFHIAFVKGGDVWYVLGKLKIKINKGMIIFVTRNYTHSRILDPLSNARMALVRFNILNNTDNQPAPMNCEPFAFTYAAKDQQKYHCLFSTMVKYFRNPITEQRKPIANSILQQLLLELYDDLNMVQYQNLNDPRIDKTIQYVKENIQKPVSIEELSAMAGLSENQYRRLFEKSYDMKPKKYFIRMKAHIAFELITESSLSIKDISSQLGYSDQYAFSKQFKSIFGKSPSQVRSGQ